MIRIAPGLVTRATRAATGELPVRRSRSSWRAATARPRAAIAGALGLLQRHWPGLALLVFFVPLFAHLLSTHMLEERPAGLYSGGSAYWDLPFHLSVITSFVERGLLETLREHPIFSGKRLTYPFLPDLLSAWLVEAGVPLRHALILPTLVGVVAAVLGLQRLTLRITRSRLGGFLAPFLFFFYGSLFGLQPFWQAFQQSGLSLWDFLSAMPRAYPHTEYVQFSNVIVDSILPQRAFTFGFALGIPAISFLWRYWESREPRHLLHAGLCVAVLPLVHTHTFLAIGMAAGLLSLGQLLGNPRARGQVVMDWLHFAVPVALLALPQAWFLAPHDGTGFFRWHLGWTKRPEESLAWFWVRNLSPHLVLFPIAFTYAGRALRRFYLPFLGLFVASNLVLFQPHDYDNHKLLLWWLLMSTVLVAAWMQRIQDRLGSRDWLVLTPLVAAMTLTGAVSVYWATHERTLLFDREDLALADFVKTATPAGARFLTSDRHSQAIACLTGRQIVMGHRGWLWTHGLTYDARLQDVIAMYRGDDDAHALMRRYGVSHVLVEHRHVIGANVAFFARHHRLLYRSPNYLLFEVRPRPSSRLTASSAATAAAGTLRE